MLDHKTLEELPNAWRSVWKNRDTTEFIKYEFEKHFQRQDIITDSREYFTTVIKYHKQMMLTETLQSVLKTGTLAFDNIKF